MAITHPRVSASLVGRLDRQPLAVGVQGLCGELDKERHDLPVRPLDQDAAILPDPVEMLEWSRRITLVHVDVMHTQPGRVGRAEDEDTHTPEQLRLQGVERIIPAAVNPVVAQDSSGSPAPLFVSSKTGYFPPAAPYARERSIESVAR